MPKYPGIHKKILKSSIKYYGSAWSPDEYKAINTPLYPTAIEAKEALDQLRKQITAGVRFDKKKITVQQFIELYLTEYYETKTLDPSTKKLIRGRLYNGIVPILGGRTLRSLHAVDIQNIQNELLAKYSPGTVNSYIGEFKRVIKRALIWDYLSKDITLGLDSVKEQVKKPDILEPQQILSIMYDQQIPLRERCLIGLGGFAGLRISEAVAVRKDKINFDEHTIFINIQHFQGRLKPPKAGSERYVPILPDFEHILKEMYLQSTYWLFPGKIEGHPLTSVTWTARYFSKVLQTLDLPPVRFHSLRHAFNKMLYDHGIPQREVMQIMGHKPQGMTWRYDRESVERCVRVTRDVKFLKGFSQNIPQNIHQKK
jgi:integrase